MQVVVLVITVLVITVPVLIAVGMMIWSLWRARIEKKLIPDDRSVSTETGAPSSPDRSVSGSDEAPRLRDLVIDNLRKKKALRKTLSGGGGAGESHSVSAMPELVV